MFGRRNHGSYVWWAQLFLFPSLFYFIFLCQTVWQRVWSHLKKKASTSKNLFGVNTFYHEGGVLLIQFYVASVIFFIFNFLPVWIPGKHLLSK